MGGKQPDHLPPPREGLFLFVRPAGRRNVTDVARRRLERRLPGQNRNLWQVDFWSTSKPLAVVPFWDYTAIMRIIALSTLKNFWENPAHTTAKEPLPAWHRFALNADWASPTDIKSDFRSASILQDGRAVFNIAGNKYRLVVWLNYPYRVIYIRFIGTHAQYDAINPQTV
jgi:mRNA interferase HigB